MDKPSISLPANFVIAAASTSSASVFTNPLEVVKTRIQLQNELVRHGAKVYRNPFQALWAVARTEGIAGLQTGLLTSVGYQIAIGGTRIGLFECVKSHFRMEKGSDFYVLKSFAAAASVGCVASVVGNPFYLMKTRMQASSSAATLRNRYVYNSAWEGFVHIHKTEGWRGFFRGVGGAIPRVSLGSASQLVSYEFAKQSFKEKQLFGEGLSLHFAASLASGLVCVTCMNPFDVVTVRLYNQPLDDRGRGKLYRGPLHCISEIVAKEGVSGLFKGWVSQYFRLGPHTVLTFVFWEQYKQLYGSLL